MKILNALVGVLVKRHQQGFNKLLSFPML